MINERQVRRKVLIRLATAILAVPVSEDVGALFLRILSEFLLLFKPFLKLITSFESSTAFIISAIDWVLVLDGLIDLFLEVLELICFFHEIEESFLGFGRYIFVLLQFFKFSDI